MPRVLLIEDSPVQALDLTLLLEEAGFSVAAVADAEQGLLLLERDSFEAVLTDLMLPGASGFDFCRRLKADPRYRQIPVLVLTSQADPVNVLRGLEAGADGFMTKSHAPDDVIGSLRRILENQQSSSNGLTRVVFLEHSFDLSVSRAQLVNVLLTSFEDVVHVNEQYQTTVATLRKVNGQLQDALASEQKAHEQLRLTQGQLVQAEKLAAVGELVAGAAHEINNPLAVISNNLAVLERDLQFLQQIVQLYQRADLQLAEAAPDLAREITSLATDGDLAYTLANLGGLVSRSRESSARIERIIKGLREFARMESRKLEATDLNQAIRSTLQQFDAEARKRGIALSSDLAPLPPIVCIVSKVSQVMFNLISNALDACTSGGKVSVVSRPLCEGVEIQVLDDGAGIDPSLREKIFDPFFTTKPVGKGMGLGLSVSYGIVKDHGGRLGYDARSPRGTRFTLWLPPRPPERV